MKKGLTVILLLCFLSGCGSSPSAGLASPLPTATNVKPTLIVPHATLAMTPIGGGVQANTPSPIPIATPTTIPTKTNAALATGIPAFDHIIVILFENRDYAEVAGNSAAPNFNRLAQQNVLFTNYYAVTHPSLPNYLALIGGSTFGISSDCGNCFINQPSLPDRIEASGRTWKTYQEDLPAPCTVASSGEYDENHDPFVYFDPIRTNAPRCQKSVVPLTQLAADLSSNQLPNFAFIMPNLCNSAHSCGISAADQWVETMVSELQASPSLGQKYMIFIVFDESSSDHSSCCGLPQQAGGRVFAALISPLARNGFQENTPLDHYSLLKTILLAWNLPGLGFTEDPATQAITPVWK